MRTWFTLLRTRTFTIRVHYTWLLLSLGIWSLARTILPGRLGADGAVWTTAFVLIMIYIGCVAVHEAAHLLVARLLGVPIAAINVHPIGTLARVGREQTRPGRKLAIATAGPIANLLLWLLRQISPVLFSLCFSPVSKLT